jgi:hypothetical protein
MKNIYEIENIIDGISADDWAGICNLMDYYYQSNFSADAEQRLARAIAPYGLTVEEILTWDAE